MENQELVDKIISKFLDVKFEFDLFKDAVVGYFLKHPRLNVSGESIIHSIKCRIKDPEHLKEKVARKLQRGDIITEENIFEKVTDLAGVRVLHLYQEQFSIIHEVIWQKIETGDWFLFEKPKAYTWDPESVGYFRKFPIEVHQKETLYTSIHYVVMPKEKSPICCEIQVRTLFEEIWGEVDHSINYPSPTSKLSCQEQIKVLAKLVGAGSRLVDSIYRSHQ